MTRSIFMPDQESYNIGRGLEATRRRCAEKRVFRVKPAPVTFVWDAYSWRLVVEMCIDDLMQASDMSLQDAQAAGWVLNSAADSELFGVCSSCGDRVLEGHVEEHRYCPDCQSSFDTGTPYNRPYALSDADNAVYTYSDRKWRLWRGVECIAVIYFTHKEIAAYDFVASMVSKRNTYYNSFSHSELYALPGTPADARYAEIFPRSGGR